MDNNMQRLGFGAMRLPYKGGESNIDLEHLKKMVDLFLEKGFMYFDTAYGYHNGQSELALKETLVKRHPRSAYYIATKMPVWNVHTTEDLERIFNKQLNKLGLDYIDYYLLHSMGSKSEETALKTKAYDFCKRLKREGKVRFIGFSFHDSAAVLEQILKAHPEMEFVQLQINYLDIKEGSAADIYNLARRFNKPIIIMEPVKGGELARLSKPAESVLKSARPNDSIASWALRYCASLPGVYITLSGMSDLRQVEDNIKTFNNFEPLSEEEEKLIDTALRLHSRADIPCTACKYCLEKCPKQISIPDVFTGYNHYRRTADKAGIGVIPKGRGANDCINCGACLERCPQNINIPEELADIAKVFA